MFTWGSKNMLTLLVFKDLEKTNKHTNIKTKHGRTIDWSKTGTEQNTKVQVGVMSQLLIVMETGS